MPLKTIPNNETNSITGVWRFASFRFRAKLANSKEKKKLPVMKQQAQVIHCTAKRKKKDE